MSFRALQDRIQEYTRRLGLGEMRSPDPLDADPANFEDVGGFKLPANFREVDQDAKDFEQLIKCVGWTKLLNAVEKEADKALARLRICESNDPAIIKAMRDRWAEAESRLQLLQKIPQAKIDERDMMLQDIAQRYGATSTDDVLSEVKVVQQMKQQLKREGMIGVTHEEMYAGDEGRG